MTPWERLKARRDELVSKTIELEGRLVHGSTTCTLVACVGGGCCNSCTGALFVESDLGRVQVQASDLRCKGDESQVCCTHGVDGQRVRVRGVLSAVGASADPSWDHGLSLDDANVCAN